MTATLPRRLIDRFCDAGRPAHRPLAGAEGLWRLQADRASITTTRRSAGSARSKCGWRAARRKCAARRNCAIACSTRKARRSPARRRGSRGATSMLFDADLRSSAGDRSCAARHGRRRRWSAPTGCCASASPNSMADSTPPAEFDIGQHLVKRHPESEFSRARALLRAPPYRNKRTVELLWHGIWTYVLRHQLDVMIGCA